MQSPLLQRGWLLVPLGLVAGVAIGALTPSSSKQLGREVEGARPTSAEGAAVSTADLPGETGADGEIDGELFRGAESGGPATQISPEKLLEVFDRVSNLRSESRKYMAAYRLVSQLGLEQMEKAMELALVDWNDNKDYSTTRAVARRWADLDPAAVVKKGVELKNYHVLQPAMETWLKTDPAEPLKWALKQDPETQLGAIKQMMEIRADFKGKQVEQLVMAAADSPVEGMRTTIFPMAVIRMGEENPMAALHAAENASTPAARQQLMSTLLQRLGKTQPDAAGAWLSSQTNLPAAERKVYEGILKATRPAAVPPK
jgi:hypothetical protein